LSQADCVCPLAAVHGASGEEEVVDSGYSTPAEADRASAATSSDDENDEKSADEFEHKYARGWLERIVKISGDWCEEAEEAGERELREQVVEAAAGTCHQSSL
jgi:hypothetical protein